MLPELGLVFLSLLLGTGDLATELAHRDELVSYRAFQRFQLVLQPDVFTSHQAEAVVGKDIVVRGDLSLVSMNETKTSLKLLSKSQAENTTTASKVPFPELPPNGPDRAPIRQTSKCPHLAPSGSSTTTRSFHL